MSTGPKTNFVGQKRGARRLDMKNGGVKNFSSFILTLMVNKKMKKGGHIFDNPVRTYVRQSGENKSMEPIYGPNLWTQSMDTN